MQSAPRPTVMVAGALAESEVTLRRSKRPRGVVEVAVLKYSTEMPEQRKNRRWMWDSAHGTRAEMLESGCFLTQPATSSSRSLLLGRVGAADCIFASREVWLFTAVRVHGSSSSRRVLCKRC